MGMSEARSFTSPLRRQPMTATAREAIGTALIRARQSFMMTMFSLGLCLDVLSTAPPPHAGNDLMSSTARTHDQQKALSLQEVRDIFSTYGSCLKPTRYDGTALLLGKIHAISTGHWEKCDAKLSEGDVIALIVVTINGYLRMIFAQRTWTSSPAKRFRES